MEDESLTLASDFPPASYDDWRKVADEALKGAPFDKKLVSRTYEGIPIQPIYTRHDWPAEGDPSGLPGFMPFTRGGDALGNHGGWDIRQAYRHPDLAKLNEQLRLDLNRGATAALLHLDLAARAGLDPDDAAAADLAGRDGAMIYCVDDLAAACAGLDTATVSLALDGGSQFLPAAAILVAWWQRRGVDLDEVRGAFHADPLGVLAATGTLPMPTDRALAVMADLAAYTAEHLPNVTAVGVDTSPYHRAGATEAQDLGCAMATGLAYLKAMTAGGLEIDTAARQIAFTFSLGCNFFPAIAKLRAARKLWARVTEACGVSEDARAMRLNAVTADRMMTRRDPWVNLLRGTVAGFAAGVAGAESVCVQPFDARLGLSDDFARRIARNTSIVLIEESSLTRVVDPAGGSWFIETLTDQIAREGWADFQKIEQAGGMERALSDGLVHGWLAQAWDTRAKNIARRRDAVTGVSEFPNIHEVPVEREIPDVAALRADAVDRVVRSRAATGAALAEPEHGALTVRAVEAARAGATIGTLSAALAGAGGAAVTALPTHHYAEEFEALRDASDAYQARTGARPRIFLSNIGTVAQHTARATFAKNFFEAGGIEAVTNNGFKTGAEAAEAFKTSGASIAIVCSSDKIYEGAVADVAPALKQAGCSYLFLAGSPGDKKADYQAAGVDDFIFLGGDVLATLRATLAHLGAIDR